MLADPKFKVMSEEQIQNFIAMATKPNEKFPETVMTEEECRQFVHDRRNPERPEGYPVGVFFAWQLEHDIEGIKEPSYEPIHGITPRKPEHQDSEWFFEKAGYHIWELPSYGVCDNVEQILAHYDLSDPNRKFCIGVSPIFKKDQPERGGWRWHKWGPYLGTHEPKCEYLYDEEGIEYVLIYHIYELE